MHVSGSVVQTLLYYYSAHTSTITVYTLYFAKPVNGSHFGLHWQRRADMRLPGSLSRFSLLFQMYTLLLRL